MHFRKYDKAINIEGLGLDVNVELQQFLFFVFSGTMWFGADNEKSVWWSIASFCIHIPAMGTIELFSLILA